jgi:hypothetical protein
MKKDKSQNPFLKIMIAVCLAFVLFRLGEFIYGHVPPLSEGKCYVAKRNPLIGVKDLENNIVGGYSEVELNILFMKRTMKASFQDLRETDLIESECL